MKTQNTESKLNMINHTVMKLPNMIWEFEPLHPTGSAAVSPDDPAPGSTVSAYIKVREEEAKRRPAPEELRVGGPVSDGANASDASPDSQRAGGPATEGADAKDYEPGDMPPNAGPGFSDNPTDRDLPKLTHSPNPPAYSCAISPSLATEEAGARRSAPAASQKPKLDNMKPDNLETPNSSFIPQPSSLTSIPQPSFTVLQSDWIELSPYGDFGHPRGIQRVDRDAAERIVAQFNSFWSRLGRRFAGVPVYVGHPDVPEYANEYTDKKAYGWITELQARGSGLFAKVKWSQQGREFLQNAHYKFYSPYWEAVFVGEKDGKKIYRPSNLLSVGLTNQPNLPVPPLANAKGSMSEKEERRKDAGSPNSDFVARDSSLTPQPSSLTSIPHPSSLSLPLANEVLALQTLLKQRDEHIHALHAQLENSRTQWRSEQAHFENEISALRNTVERLENSRIEIVLDRALTDGRIAPAEREFWNTQLRRDFDIRHEELKQRPEVMHMKSVTGELGKNKVDLANADLRKKILFELLEAKQRQGMSHHDAWFALKKERPDIFAAMQGNH